MIGDRGENLIFILSQPRAGSTLLQRILCAHPAIHTTAEPWIMLHPLYALKRAGYSAEYNAAWARAALDDFCQSLAEGEAAYEQAIRQMALHLYRSALLGSAKTRFLDKTPRYYFVLPELVRVFPAAQYVFLLRNPLAVLISILESWVKGNWPELALFRHDLLDAPRRLVEGIALRGREAITLHYEDLAADPQPTVSRLCEQLGLAFEAGMLEYGRHPPPRGTMGDSLGVPRHTRPVPDGVDRWIRGLASPQAHFLAEAYLAFLGEELLGQMGYSFERLRRILVSHRPAEALEEGAIRVLLEPLGLEPPPPSLASPQAEERAGVLGAISPSGDVEQPDWPPEIFLLVSEADRRVGRGDFLAALESLDSALERLPGDSWLLLARGNVLLQLGQVEAAHAAFKRAALLSPQYAPAHSSLALASLALGQVEACRASLERALALDPQDVIARQLASRLRIHRETAIEIP